MNEGIIDIQRGIANLNPFAQRPVMIEDALGWEFPVPLEIIRTWHVRYPLYAALVRQANQLRLLTQSWPTDSQTVQGAT